MEEGLNCDNLKQEAAVECGYVAKTSLIFFSENLHGKAHRQQHDYCWHSWFVAAQRYLCSSHLRLIVMTYLPATGYEAGLSRNLCLADKTECFYEIFSMLSKFKCAVTAPIRGSGMILGSLWRGSKMPCALFLAFLIPVRWFLTALFGVNIDGRLFMKLCATDVSLRARVSIEVPCYYVKRNYL